MKLEYRTRKYYRCATNSSYKEVIEPPDFIKKILMLYDNDEPWLGDIPSWLKRVYNINSTTSYQTGNHVIIFDTPEDVINAIMLFG